MDMVLQPDDRWIDVNGMKLHYLDWGNTDAPAMVLLHGHTGHAHAWDTFASSLRLDYHVLAVDQRGHGDSSWAKSYHPDDYTLDLAGFVTGLQFEEMVLIGHSMGGIVATVYAARYPERVRQLVIGDIGPEIAEAGIKWLEDGFRGGPLSFSSEDEALQYFRSSKPKASEDLIHHQLQYALKRDASGRLVFKFDPALLQTKIASPQWLWDYLERIVCPALVVHGTESNILLPQVVRRMIDSLVFGSSVDIAHAGHSLLEDNPGAFEAAVRQFLSRQDLT